MAYWINAAGNSIRPNWRQFYCDADTDISNLPTSFYRRFKNRAEIQRHINVVQ